MPGLGTIVNCAAVAAGGILGMLFGKKINEKTRDQLMKVLGVAVIFTGMAGTLSYMLKPSDNGATLTTYGTLMMILCLAIGTFIGELLKIEKLIEKFGIFLKKKFAKNDEGFVAAFVNTSLVVCVGAMAIVGSLQDGLEGDHTTLFAKALLDFLIVMVMGSTMGIGCAFAFIPIAILQGSVTALAKLAEPLLNVGTVIGDMALVGNVMIFCIGMNLVFGKKFNVGNMLPGLVLAVAWSLVSFYCFS